MNAETYKLSFSPAILERGFWLYVWRIQTLRGERLYVGRTGDESSPHASPPFVRMSQHLGWKKQSNALRRNLENDGINPKECHRFELISHGPIFPEVKKWSGATREALMEKHKPRRDQNAAMEKQLADDLSAVGYNVLNEVQCRRTYDPEIWKSVREAFSEEFPRLKNVDFMDTV